jgi:hypothetical protein
VNDSPIGNHRHFARGGEDVLGICKLLSRIGALKRTDPCRDIGHAQCFPLKFYKTQS